MEHITNNHANPELLHGTLRTPHRASYDGTFPQVPDQSGTCKVLMWLVGATDLTSTG